MPKLVDRGAFIAEVVKNYGNIDVISRSQVLEVCEKLGLTNAAWLTNDLSRRAGRGLYSLNSPSIKPAKREKVRASVPTPSVPVPQSAIPVANSIEASADLRLVDNTISLIPDKTVGYVPFGHYNDVRSIINSRKFYPTFITGLSGNGKTLMVEQICAADNRECVRVNITVETDEDDLIGGFRLMDGRTVWQNGPVIIAMERGATLLLDEIDLASNKIMCLQPVLEGKPIFIKKINKIIYPAPGFNIFATANTKGKGNDDGRFIGTNILNEAFLERFPITFEQEYPAEKTEIKIINNIFQKGGVNNPEFAEKLVLWANVIRKSFYEGAASEIISTRRLVHIAEAYLIFGRNETKAIELCLNRFDFETKTSFMELYNKLNYTPDTTEIAAAVENVVANPI